MPMQCKGERTPSSNRYSGARFANGGEPFQFRQYSLAAPCQLTSFSRKNHGV